MTDDKSIRGDMVAHHEATEAIMRAEVDKLRAKVAAAERMAEALRDASAYIDGIGGRRDLLRSTTAALAAWEAAQ